MEKIKQCLDGLDYLVQQKCCSAFLKDQIHTLKIDLKFLRTFVMCGEALIIGEMDFIRVYRKVEAIIQDMESVIFTHKDGNAATDLDGDLYSVIDKIELIRPQIHEYYQRDSLRLAGTRTGVDRMVDFVDTVLKNMEDVLQAEVKSIVRLKGKISTLEKKLRFLRKSLQFDAKMKINGIGLSLEVRKVVAVAASLSFNCWINKNEPQKEPDLSSVLNIWTYEQQTSLYGDISRASESLASDAKDALLVDLIDFLLEQLAEILHRDGSLGTATKDQFESLAEGLKLGRSLLMTTSKPHAKLEKSYRQHFGAQLNKVAHLIEYLHVGNMSEEMVATSNATRLQLLGRLKLINLFCMVDRVKDETSLVAPIKDQLKTLCEDIQLLGTSFYFIRKDKTSLEIFSIVDDMALDALSALHPFYVDGTKEDMAHEMSCFLPDLLEIFKLFKVDMRKIYPLYTSSDFSETSGHRGTKVFLKELNELLSRRADKVLHYMHSQIGKYAKVWIETVHNELPFLISFLEKSEELCLEIGELDALVKRIMNVANEAQHITDPIFLREHPVSYCMLKFFDLMDEVKLIKKEIESVNEKNSDVMLSSSMAEVIVGFEDEADKIIEQLIGKQELHVTSIVGMGGLGKTTLAKKLYNNPLVVGHFDVRAWCCISQAFEKRQVLLDILGQVVELTEKTDEDLEAMLYKSLRGRRYLIVMDDVWDIEAWKAVRRCFHDDHMGSRIIFTTRLQEVALKVQARSSICHNLRFFDDNESQELLKKKLFPGGRCPLKQVEIVEQIAKSCKGLPLAIALMAGILARKKKEEWAQVAKSLSQHTDGDLQNLSMKLLEYSYQNLPHHLKRCFLYLGAFPEDKEIPVKKLTWLWSAEGFIQKIEQKILEDIAKDYLMDLIGGSLVMIAERGSNGGVKACRIHDVSRSFTLAKAEEEKFLLLLGGNQQVDRHIESYNSNPITSQEYRLSIYSMLNDLEKWPSSSRVCSLLHFAPTFHLGMASPYDTSYIFSRFKDLHVLDLGRLLLKDFSSEIELLVHLRLLAIQIQSRSIPSSIAVLQNLEIFLVKGVRGEVEFPDTIWSMVNLRHLHIDKRASSIWDKRDKKDANLDKIETLSTPIIWCDTNSSDLARSLPNLRKLKCIFTASWSNIENCNCFPDLVSLLQLESLKVFYYATSASHGRFSFPKNLKKLTLSMFRLPWSDITAIGKALPNLEVLKLLSRAFEGKQWETREGEFCKLKYLKLESLDIEQWYVSSKDHLPLLEKLVVHRCKQLKAIPSTVGDIDTLEMIEVKWCNESAASSAKGIYEEQQEYGNEGFKAIIHPYPTESGLASS